MSTNLDALLAPIPTVSKVNVAALGGKPRVLTIDIEVSPNLVWEYNTRNINYISPKQVVEPQRILCFAAKWHDSKRALFYSEFHNGTEDMLDALWHLLDEADVVVSYNGRGFDMKHIRWSLVKAGYTPPSPAKDVDLFSTVRSQFAMPHKKLDTVCKDLGLGGKVEIGGFDLWIPVLAGDEKAWKLCRKYNIQDVLLTEALLDRLGPWVKGFPHMGLWNGEDRCCWRCGDTDLKQFGWHLTAITRYARLQCQDCGAWNRATHIKTRTTTRAI
jgi:DNA polymerase elongation subunit (family B)